MRTFRLVLALAGPAVTGGANVAAQAVERTDAPDRGILRVTFDPRIMTWNDEFTDAGRRRLGFGLTGDTVGSRYIPALAALEQNVRTVTGDLVPVIRPQVVGPGDVQPLLPRFVASLGAGLLSVRQERRTYPITAELGVTNRLSVSLTVPIVRVATRSSLNLSTTRANLGLNPRLTVSGADGGMPRARRVTVWRSGAPCATLCTAPHTASRRSDRPSCRSTRRPRAAGSTARWRASGGTCRRSAWPGSIPRFCCRRTP